MSKACKLHRLLHFLNFICFLYFISSPLLHAQSQASPSMYAITHAKIFTLAGLPIEDGTLVIRDGKIAAVGPGVEVPAGAQVIDAKGLQVYPGLFDAVTQMGLSEIGAVSATVDTSETGSYNPDVVAATAVSPSSEHIPVTRASGITEVLAVPGSGGFAHEGVEAGSMWRALPRLSRPLTSNAGDREVKAREQRQSSHSHSDGLAPFSFAWRSATSRLTMPRSRSPSALRFSR